jgi:AcrR family transcriptional regulator
MDGPRTATTPERLIDVASRMFATRGVDAVSIRSITREAGVGAAAIHYHFSSKEALLDAIIDRHSPAVVSAVQTRARALLATSPRPSAWEFVDCVATPYFQLLDDHPRDGSEWLGIIGQLSRVQDERVMRGSVETTGLLYQLVHRAFPTASREQCELATSVSISTLLTLLGQQDSGRRGATTLSPAGRRLIVDFVAGGLAVAATRG